MAGLIHYRNADTLNDTPVSDATPLPVTTTTPSTVMGGAVGGGGLSLAAGVAGSPIAGVPRLANGILDVVASFAPGASLSLQYLKADGVTWGDLVTGITSSTMSTGIAIIGGATLRLNNVGTGAITGLFAAIG